MAEIQMRRQGHTRLGFAYQLAFVRLADSLSSPFKRQLDEMLIAGDKRLTPFQSHKEPPGKASPNGMLRLATKLELIQATGVLEIDLSWSNNNYQRSLTRYARRCSADGMRNLKEEHRYIERFPYLRQFAPTLLDRLDFHLEEGTQSTIVAAVQLLQQMNAENRRKLPDDAPLGFIPKKLRPLVEKNGEVSKRAWECALLTAVRDEIKAGNIYVLRSKRFGRFDDFFMEDTKIGEAEGMVSGQYASYQTPRTIN